MVILDSFAEELIVLYNNNMGYTWLMRKLTTFFAELARTKLGTEKEVLFKSLYSWEMPATINEGKGNFKMTLTPTELATAEL